MKALMAIKSLASSHPKNTKVATPHLPTWGTRSSHTLQSHMRNMKTLPIPHTHLSSSIAWKHICSAAGIWVQMPGLLHCMWVRQHSQMYLYRVCVQHLSPLSPKIISWVTKMTLKLDPEESVRLFANSGSRCDVKHGSISSCCSRGVDCALRTVMRREAASVAPAPRLLGACSWEGVQRNPDLAIGSCYLLWDK